MPDPRHKLTANIRRTIWRWLYLCVLTSHLTLVTICEVQAARGYPFLAVEYYPIQTGIIIGTLFVTTVFLVFVTPFFFRRAGALAVATWVYALASLVYMSLPVF